MLEESEIREAFETAAEKGRTSSAYRNVADALGWVLEENDTDPSE